jgi:hypothetical protein
MHGIAADGLGDGAFIGGEFAVSEGDVDLLHLADSELRGKMAMGSVVARDQDDAASEAIQPVDDAGAKMAAYGRKLLEAMQHRINEGSGVLTGARMDHHPRRLIDRDDIGVLIQDIERQVLGRGAERGQFPGIHVDALSAFQHERTLLGRAVHKHAALSDPILKTRAAVLRELLAKELIEPFATIDRRGFQSPVIVNT